MQLASGRPPAESSVKAERLLEVVDLQTHIRTRRGVVRAVDGVTFALDRGRTLGIVGESGCGKTMTALSIMRLLPRPARRVVGGSDLASRARSSTRSTSGRMRHDPRQRDRDDLPGPDDLAEPGDDGRASRSPRRVLLHRGLTARRARPRAIEVLGTGADRRRPSRAARRLPAPALRRACASA